MSWVPVVGNLENLAFDIQQAGSLTDKHRRRYQKARELPGQAIDGDDGDTSTKLLTHLQERVNKEMSADGLWVPTPGPDPQAA